MDQEKMKKLAEMRENMGSAKAGAPIASAVSSAEEKKKAMGATSDAMKKIAAAKAKAFVSSKKAAHGKGKSRNTGGVSGFMKVDRPRPGKNY